MTVETALEHARRAFALKKYEQAVEHYATALELQYVTSHPTTAHPLKSIVFPLCTGQRTTAKTRRRWQICIFRMGKHSWRMRYLKLPCWERNLSLVHRAKRRNVGRRPFCPMTIFDTCSPAVGPGNKPILEFGDGEEGEDEDGTVDLLGQADKEPEESDDEDEASEGEVEDDFNAAWEVLELARSIYEKGGEGDDRVKLKLADTYIALGDVSLETGTTPVLPRYCIIDAHPQRSLTMR